MKQYKIEGMSCASCAARLEKTISNLDGVISCNISLLTNSLVIEGDILDEEVIRAVEKASFKAFKQEKDLLEDDEEEGENVNYKEARYLRNRFIWSAIFLAFLIYFSMGHMMWKFPLPTFIKESPILIASIQAALSGAILFINRSTFIKGFKSLFNKAPNMDTLVALGSGVAFAYSIVLLIFMFKANLDGDKFLLMSYMHKLSFETAAMILTIINLGKMLEAISKGKTGDSVRSLMKLKAKKARLVIDGKEEIVDINHVKVGDIFSVYPGESLPVDGQVLDGHSAIDESALTGESVPVDKDKGDMVSAATINQNGYIVCKATRVGNDTSIAQIINMVSEAAASKAPIAKIADKVSSIFVPVVLLIALATFIIWLLVGASLSEAISYAVAVLVISCPCSLGLATPVAIMVASGLGARNGILFKKASSLEEVGKIKMVALDKTGTITNGESEVTDIYPLSDTSEEDLLSFAYMLEKKSEHPYAKAIVKEAINKDVCDKNAYISKELKDFKAFIGQGISAIYDGSEVMAGNYNFIKTFLEDPNEVQALKDSLEDLGKRPLFFVKANKCLGAIVVADDIKKDSYDAIKELKDLGIDSIILTGDNKVIAQNIAKEVGISAFKAELLPQDKANIIKELKVNNKVAMVGDGINDAIALKSADVGIAIGAGTDVAIEAADIVLVNSTISDLVSTIRISKATIKNIYQNLFWAFIYNIVGIPLAAGAFVSLLGWSMNPIFAAAAMSMSSVCVVLNALRLNLFKIKK